MFKGPIVWRGIIYTALMVLGKLLTGLWLVRFSFPSPTPLNHFRLPLLPNWCCWGSRGSRTNARGPICRTRGPRSQSEAGTSTDIMAATGRQRQGFRPESRIDQSQELSRSTSQNRSKLPKPRSLYPASIVGAAMVSRGEIGFLIASVAESKGILANTSSPRPTAHGEGSEIYLVVIWAVVLCTVIGPITVGPLTKRLKKLQTKERAKPSGIDPLGIWGVI